MVSGRFCQLASSPSAPAIATIAWMCASRQSFQAVMFTAALLMRMIHQSVHYSSMLAIAGAAAGASISCRNRLMLAVVEHHVVSILWHKGQRALGGATS